LKSDKNIRHFTPSLYYFFPAGAVNSPSKHCCAAFDIFISLTVTFRSTINNIQYTVARMGEGRGVYRFLVGKPEGRRPLGRPRRRWEDNIRMDLRELGCGWVDWMELAQDRDR
jgi:hypothetical protein